MLGQFLELALVTEDPGAAWQRYLQLGFVDAPAGDLWNYAYGVAACHDLAIGLHARGTEPLSLVFVHQNVAALHRELSASGIVVESAHLGSDVFNELTVRDPGGTALRVLEARTFSPPSEIPAQTLLGTFATLSLPCRDMEAVTEFWEKLHVVAAPVEQPWEGLVLSTTPLAYHPRRVLPEAALVFRQSPGVTDELADAAALQRERGLPALEDLPHDRLRTAEDLTLIARR